MPPRKNKNHEGKLRGICSFWIGKHRMVQHGYFFFVAFFAFFAGAFFLAGM
jgi:hypothetical protein